MWFLKNSCSILYIVFACLILMCSSFVILSSASGENNINLFEVGQVLNYHLQSTVLLNEKNNATKNVGFYIDGLITVKSIWGAQNDRILQVEISSPQLHIKSRKSPSPDGFVPHSSTLEKNSNKPFLIVWKKGQIDKILLPKDESISLINLKKGIASLFQLQILDSELREVDASGDCLATYKSISNNHIIKSKTDCISHDLPYVINEDPTFSTQVESSRSIDYIIDDSNTFLKSIKLRESHEMYTNVKEELGNQIQVKQVLIFKEKSTAKTESYGDNLDVALNKILESFGSVYTQETLQTEREIEEAGESFVKSVDALRDHLDTKLLGKLKPAKAFLNLISIARSAKFEEIEKVLKSKKNKNILPQIYDILGFAQTQESYKAAMKKLHLDNENHLDNCERYLWALSFAAQPNPIILEDLLHKFQNFKNVPEKLKETLILTIASMAKKLRTSKLTNPANLKLAKKIEEVIINELDYAKKEDRFKYFRALKNLKSDSTIPKLLHFIKSGTPKEEVLAWKALKSFDPKFWSDKIIIAAEKSLYQLDKKYDSSARTLAADILLESSPSDHQLKEFLTFLTFNETAFEVKQYLYQRIKMLAEENVEFNNKMQAIIKSDKYLNNYSTLSPRGLSTALKRTFLNGNQTKGSLVSIQEIHSGIAKRGVVNVVMEKNGYENELFSLGIFTGGLQSFVSSNNDDDGQNEEAANAGMEITLLGNQMRPFVFFSGQGELMGHVWAGTASEKTPAYQALIMLQDHLEYIRLGSGFIAQLENRGALSFDLSGQMEISIWNRNAKSLIQKSTAILTTGTIKVDTDFVKSLVEFVASIEPQLNIQTDIDFSSNINLCMRVSQPDTLFRHNIFKIERIPNSKHRLRISKYKKYDIPGTTYSLNRKNNEMCSSIFS